MQKSESLQVGGNYLCSSPWNLELRRVGFLLRPHSRVFQHLKEMYAPS